MSETQRRQRRKVLTDKMVAAMPRRRKRYIQADPELRGHYVRVPPQGPCVFAAVARSPYGKQVWATLGTADVLAIDAASEQAREAIKRIKAGLPAFEAAAGAARHGGRRVRGLAQAPRRGQGPAHRRRAERVLEKLRVAALARPPLHGNPAQRRCRPARRGRGPARPRGWPIRCWRCWAACRRGSPPATTITCRPSSRACGASRRRRASAAAS